MGESWVPNERKQLTVLYVECGAAAATWSKAGVRTQKAPQLLGLKEASITAQIFGELKWRRSFPIDSKLT